MARQRFRPTQFSEGARTQARDARAAATAVSLTLEHIPYCMEWVL
jgi:hypothetical protein